VSDDSTYDAIVVGGGVVGASCAWHLADAGVEDVLVLEKDSPASKASGRAAGHLSTYTSRKFEPSVREYAIEFHRALASRHDAIDLREDTDHVIARSHEGRDRLEALFERDPEHFRLLSGDELAATGTVFETEGVTAALVYDGAVHTDPYTLTVALLGEAEEKGATLELSAVRAIEAGDDGFTVSADREYQTPVVVDAAGAWSGRIASMVGVDLPVKPRTSQIAVLEPRTPIEMPMFHCPDVGLYGRQELNGDVLVGGGTDVEIADPDDFSTAAREEFLQYVSEHSPSISPALDDAGLVNHWAGRCTATPDRWPLIGSTDVEGFYVCTGFNGGGVARSPFAGKLLAEHVLGVEPSFPVEPYAPDRFDESMSRDFGVKSASTDW
jgi:sarcosine oxidase subunit beta